MFGWLRRFDDWLERKHKESVPPPGYVKHNYATRIGAEPEEEKPPFDWAARKKVVERFVDKEAVRVYAEFNQEHAEAFADFTSEAWANSHMLSVTIPQGNHALNLEFLLTVRLAQGRGPSREQGHKYVIYTRETFRSADNHDFGWRENYDDYDRYYTRHWPMASVNDKITFIGTGGYTITTLEVPHGRGTELYQQIMDAIGGRSKPSST